MRIVINSEDLSDGGHVDLSPLVTVYGRNRIYEVAVESVAIPTVYYNIRRNLDNLYFTLTYDNLTTKKIYYMGSDVEGTTNITGLITRIKTQMEDNLINQTFAVSVSSSTGLLEIDSNQDFKLNFHNQESANLIGFIKGETALKTNIVSPNIINMNPDICIHLTSNISNGDYDSYSKGLTNIIATVNPLNYDFASFGFYRHQFQHLDFKKMNMNGTVYFKFIDKNKNELDFKNVPFNIVLIVK